MEIKIFNKTTKIASASMLVASCLFAGAAMAKDSVKVGVVSFLTGPAAGVLVFLQNKVHKLLLTQLIMEQCQHLIILKDSQGLK